MTYQVGEKRFDDIGDAAEYALTHRIVKVTELDELGDRRVAGGRSEAEQAERRPA